MKPTTENTYYDIHINSDGTINEDIVNCFLCHHPLPFWKVDKLQESFWQEALSPNENWRIPEIIGCLNCAATSIFMDCELFFVFKRFRMNRKHYLYNVSVKDLITTVKVFGDFRSICSFQSYVSLDRIKKMKVFL